MIGLVFGMCLLLGGCVIVQTIPERRVDPSIPAARIILEQRQAQPVPAPRGGS
jgi:hypothetical protein